MEGKKCPIYDIVRRHTFWYRSKLTLEQAIKIQRGG
jgi:hypothetical protein